MTSASYRSSLALVYRLMVSWKRAPMLSYFSTKNGLSSSSKPIVEKRTHQSNAVDESEFWIACYSAVLVSNDALLSE